MYVRSLLSSKALVNELGVAVYPQVLDGLRVDRAGSGVAPSLEGSDIVEGREGVTAESLHGCYGRIRRQGKREGRRGENEVVQERGKEQR